MTFFFQEMPELVRQGHLYLAQPPLYRLTAGGKSLYARDDAHRAAIEAGPFKGKKVEVARFKGLGEMNPGQLKETTMDPATRSLIRITLPRSEEHTSELQSLMRISYAVFCLKKKKRQGYKLTHTNMIHYRQLHNTQLRT